MENDKKNKLVEKEEETIEEYHGAHGLIYNFVGFLGFTFFAILFCGVGILAFTGKVEDKFAKWGALIFFLAGLFILYEDILFVKKIVKNISNLKKSKRKIVTLHDIGYLVYSLVFVVGVLFFVLNIIDFNSSIAKFLSNNILIIVAILGISGTILIYADKVISYFKGNEDIVIVDINKKDN